MELSNISRKGNPKKNFIFQEAELCYITGRNFLGSKSKKNLL